MWFELGLFKRSKGCGIGKALDDLLSARDKAYKEASASWRIPGSPYEDFEDCDVHEVDSKWTYLDRCYEGKEELFYTAIEAGRVPTASHAYHRFYNPSKHFTLLLPRILKVLER